LIGNTVRPAARKPGHQQPAAGFDRHLQVPGRRVVQREKLEQAGQASRVVADSFGADDRPVFVDDRDVVVAFGPVDSAAHCRH
jgi:hypothetical protein